MILRKCVEYLFVHCLSSLFLLDESVQSSRESLSFPYSPRDPCAALAAYFLCTGLRIKNNAQERHLPCTLLFQKHINLFQKLS